MNSNQIPGVPEGWEAVAIRKPVRDVDHILGPDLEPVLCDHVQQNFNCVIIRKIEKPATYRPFANAREADQFWNAALRFRNPHPGHESSRFRINAIGCDGIFIGLEFYSYGAAFSKFCIDDDGTPFGVRIDE
jgi:hypothetical protein